MNGGSMDVTEHPDCRYCGDPVDPLEPGHYKTPADQFAHRDCIADHCYDHREKVATDEGVFRIKSVTIMKTVGHNEEILDSYWQAECPVCYQTHETDSHSEGVRTDLIDEVCECCGAEWLPPADWIEDCDICGTSHRESRDCKPLSMREPFPSPDEHRYECSECGWTGEGDDFDNPDGYCPQCDSAAVRALEIATDGGQVELPNNEFICHPNTRTLHRGTREDGAECGQPDSEGWAKVDAENPMDAVLNYATQPCSKCFKTRYHDLKRVYLSEHTAVACRYETEEVLEESQWSVNTDTDHGGNNEPS